MINDHSLGNWLKEMNLGHPLTIAGPCSAETQDQVMDIGKQLSKEGSRVTVFRAGVWKPRTRPGSFEGIGAKALPWLQELKRETGLLIAIEVANSEHVKLALEFNIDILWIGARTSVNPFTVQEIANVLRGTDKIVWVKNPVNPDLELWIGAFERLHQAGLSKLGAIHRGFSSYGKSQFRNQPNWQLPIDFKSRFPEIPMICDPSHICGRRDCIEKIAQTALDLQYDGLMIESHNNPDEAWSDSKQQITPTVLHEIIHRLTVRENTFTDDPYIKILNLLRSEIDQIDDKLIDILNERMNVVAKIGAVKKDKNVAVLQKERFQEILEKIVKKSDRTGLNNDFIVNIYKQIHQESIRIQEHIINE
jgi:chorismate mutase